MKRFLVVAALAAAAGCSSTGKDTDRKDDPAWREAEAAYLGGDWNVAIAAYDRFVKTHPDDDRIVSARLHIGRCYLSLNRPASALPCLDQVVSSDPEKHLKAEAMLVRGLAQLQLGNLKKAEEEILDAIRIGENDVCRDECLFYLGVVKIRSGDWNEGLATMGAVIKEMPDGTYAARARAIRAGERAFSVQAGAFTDAAGARRRSDELRQKGYDTRIVPEGAFNCVRFGNYGTWREASEAASAMESVTGVETAVVP